VTLDDARSPQGWLAVYLSFATIAFTSVDESLAGPDSVVSSTGAIGMTSLIHELSSPASKLLAESTS
jgi:hypothetical protein